MEICLIIVIFKTRSTIIEVGTFPLECFANDVAP